MLVGEHPGPVGFHAEVPPGRRAAVQVGPGDGGPGHVTEAVLFREGGRPRGEQVLGRLWMVSGRVVLRGVVLLGEGRLGTDTQ